MKDLKTYLESGILEQYVFGDLSNEEKLDVENNALQYPEVRKELEEIENALMSYARSNAIEPSEKVKTNFLNSINTIDQVNNSPSINTGGASLRNLQFYKYAFAASLSLLFLSGILLINLNNKLNESYVQLAVLQSDNQKFSNQVNYKEGELRDIKNALQFYQDPAAYKLVTLKGSTKAPDASLLVAFNADKEEVMIDMTSLNMPSNDQEHQYQLWAIVDGKPVDLGVFDANDDSTGMKKMKFIKDVQAFAVTLEPRGGSLNPTMDKMMAIGNI
ncbi:Anti-sigma-K factor rskA [Daejeonella rubra]|uniref:Anti-sigma-K factor rskA n=1 Tax=Daejeonella rubra TaxID=990371 RepID=A0A1G9S5N5_9SPHI|nr:anti-sigma factor [Daejeonella rubra]SDM30813.1 Anti-sigma-K factor rskA [Daejeonella rubra]